MTPLKANTIISSILLLILLMLPYEAMAQRRRVRELKGPVVYSTPKSDSLRVDTLKNDTLKANVLKADTLSAESVKKKKQPLHLKKRKNQRKKISRKQKKDSLLNSANRNFQKIIPINLRLLTKIEKALSRNLKMMTKT